MRISVSLRAVRPNPLLDRTIDSIGKQTLPVDEIVIVIPSDSVDEWRDVDGLSRWTMPVRVVPAPRGMISQRSVGISTASGDWVLLVDDDAVLPPDLVRTLAVVVGQRPDITCVVPEFRTDRSSGLSALMLGAFLIAVRRDKQPGIRVLPSGGFSYGRPLREGEVVSTESGAGIAVLVDRRWCLAHGAVGDLRLQMEANPYALREDTALIYAHSCAGGRAVMVNAGEIEHLGGTTRLSSSRTEWVFNAAVRNHLVFWRHYILERRRSPVARSIARVCVAWTITGVMLMAAAAAIGTRSGKPAHGALRGLWQYLRGTRARSILR